MLSRRAVLATGATVAAGAVAAGCSSSNKAKWNGLGTNPSGGASGGGGGGKTSSANVTIVPAADTNDVSPGDTVKVTVDGGKLQTVTVAAGDKTVAGTLASDGTSWHSTGNLAYSQTYTVTVAAVDASGTATNKTATFNTIKPVSTAGITFQANPMMSLKTGGSYGVGQPVIVYFSKSVKDHAAAEQAMEVTASPSVEGKWHWVSSQAAHWRPEKYWASNTKITVKVNVLGVNLGGGVYGTGNYSTNFSIGPSRVAIADSTTFQMKVFIDGAQVKTIPVSMGKGGHTTGSKGEAIDFWTRSGIHVVMTKEPTVTMSSATFGITNPKDPNYYSETIPLACRISLSGEYVHAASWSVHDQGKRNVSHGCINISPENAQWFYNTFVAGDVVEVRNTPVQLPLTDGVGDWNVSWSNWGN
jgi:lipoprotein-anchoring transpeptidase ErfK/SrfK